MTEKFLSTFPSPPLAFSILLVVAVCCGVAHGNQLWHSWLNPNPHQLDHDNGSSVPSSVSALTPRTAKTRQLSGPVTRHYPTVFLRPQPRPTIAASLIIPMSPESEHGPLDLGRCFRPAQAVAFSLRWALDDDAHSWRGRRFSLVDLNNNPSGGKHAINSQRSLGSSSASTMKYPRGGLSFKT